MGSAFPLKTAIENSLPSIFSSIIILSSYFSAYESAFFNSFLLLTIEIPALEPQLKGFITHGI